MGLRSMTGAAQAAGAVRILLVSNMWPSEHDPVFGGFVERHAKGLAQAGASITVVANDDRRSGTLRSARKYSALWRRATRAARRGVFDVVVGHYLYPTAAIARDAAGVAAVPYVLVAHGTDVASVRGRSRVARLAREAMDEAALVVTVSSALESRVRHDLGLDPLVPVAVCGMGIDTKAFRPDAGAREKLRLSPTERVVLFAGNLVEVKGLDVLFDAFMCLADGGVADRLVIVGGGPMEEPLRRWIAEAAASDEHADPSDKILLVGQLPQSDLARWMAAADVFVLPSRSEGLGLVLLEAMACGIPCVASDVGGVPEILSDECGELVPVGDPDALSDAVARVLAAGKDSYSDTCVSRAAAHDVARKAEEFLGILETAIGRSTGGDGHGGFGR